MIKLMERLVLLVMLASKSASQHQMLAPSALMAARRLLTYLLLA
jgi:hypothetical protein